MLDRATFSACSSPLRYWNSLMQAFSFPWVAGSGLRVRDQPAGRLFLRAGRGGLSDHSQPATAAQGRSEEHTSELQSRPHLVCRLLLEKKKSIPASKRTATGNSNIRPPTSTYSPST